jgi:hypothetical protein
VPGYILELLLPLGGSLSAFWTNKLRASSAVKALASSKSALAWAKSARLRARSSPVTRHETVQQILYDRGADYLAPWKENKKTTLATAKTPLPESLSPQEAAVNPL